LVVGGALKLVDPSGTVGPLRALGVTPDPGPALFERIGDGAAGVALAVLVVVGMLIAIGVMRIGRRAWEPPSGS
jgi:hypothetical protein